ncbi:MAG: type II secretion system F family protein, partial [Brachybacterium sp.]|nr:type II secretion system F family protein [Brachybacterium sp.]
MITVVVAVLPVLLWVLTPPLVRSPVPAPPRRTRRDGAGPLEMAHLVEQLATVISSGAGPRQAWAALSRSLPAGELQDLARAAAAGADLRRAASDHLRRTDMVSSLSTALTVCERTGAPTTVMLQHLAEALRDLHDAAQARRSAFAG